MYNFDPTKRPPVLVSILIVVGMIVGMAYIAKEFLEQISK